MSNPFQSFRDESVPYAKRRKVEKAKLVPKTAQEKQEAEQKTLRELWLADFAKRKKTLIEGPFAGSAKALCSMLENLQLDDGDRLIEMSEIWRSAPRDIRFLVLQLIGEAMIELRMRHLLPPFDDPIDPDETNAFIAIRRILT